MSWRSGTPPLSAALSRPAYRQARLLLLPLLGTTQRTYADHAHLGQCTHCRDRRVESLGRTPGGFDDSTLSISAFQTIQPASCSPILVAYVSTPRWRRRPPVTHIVPHFCVTALPKLLLLFRTTLARCGLQLMTGIPPSWPYHTFLSALRAGRAGVPRSSRTGVSGTVP